MAEVETRVRGCEAHAVRADPAAVALRWVLFGAVDMKGRKRRLLLAVAVRWRWLMLL